MVKKITGLLALPRISRNGNFYYPEELAKADGKTVPLRWNHIQDNEGIIGTAKLSYDEDKMQINYEATVDNEGVEQQLVNKEFKVSLGAEPQKEEQICHDEGKCYNVPLGLDFKEMSIVETPGIPEATLDVIEYFTTESVKFEDCKCENTSNNTSIKDKIMAEETETKVTVDTKEVPAKEAPQCPEGQALKDGKCVPEAPAPEAPKAPEAVAPVAQAEPVHTEHKEADCGCSKEAEKTNVETEVNAKVEAKLESIQDEIRENYAPKATVEENTTPKGYVEEGVEEQTEELKKVLKGNSVVIEIDKEDFYKAHTVKENSPVTEAVSTSGTIPTVSAQRDIIVMNWEKVVAANVVHYANDVVELIEAGGSDFDC